MATCEFVAWQRKCMGPLLRDDTESLLQKVFFTRYKCDLSHINYICKKCFGVLIDCPEHHALQCYNKYNTMTPGIPAIKLEHRYTQQLRNNYGAKYVGDSLYLYIDVKVLLDLFPQILYLQCHDEAGKDVLGNINSDNIDFTRCYIAKASVAAYGVASKDVRRTVSSIVREIIRCFEKIGSKCLFCGMLYDSVPCMQLVASHLRCCATGSVGTNEVRSLLAKFT